MQSLSSHLLEARLRITYTSLALVFSVIFSYIYKHELVYVISNPFLEFHTRFVFLDVTEALYTMVRISGIISFFSIVPVVIYHFWCFFIPSCYFFERKRINISIYSFLLLVLLEILLIYFFIFPKLCAFFMSFEIKPEDSSLSSSISDSLCSIESSQSSIEITPSIFNKEEPSIFNREEPFHFTTFDEENVRIQNHNDTLFFSRKSSVLSVELIPRLQSYFKYIFRFFFFFVIILQSPLICLFFYSRKWIHFSQLCEKRKYIFFLCVILASFFSPPDFISQIVLSLAAYIVCEILIFLGLFYSIEHRV